ncbi:unnamed protein product [Pleuronectes platessa]|uniref:Uncharacterized protein n=1 Tax=Pleuronectes platessa TaxID=8262 RepID=A0A9N7Z832_PLEPL|nr:unnamed protein product [Pleuronectes platessa]
MTSRGSTEIWVGTLFGSFISHMYVYAVQYMAQLMCQYSSLPLQTGSAPRDIYCGPQFKSSYPFHQETVNLFGTEQCSIPGHGSAGQQLDTHMGPNYPPFLQLGIQLELSGLGQ